MKRLILLALMVGSLSVVGMASASSSNMLSVSPSPTHVGDSLVMAGCGYTPGVYVTAQAVHDTRANTIILQVGETVDASGCFSTSDFAYLLPAGSDGKWTASVWESGHKDATLIFTVAAP